MSGDRLLRFGLPAIALLIMIAGPATAQNVASGMIAGVVKDSSGAVLPGVTVEAVVRMSEQTARNILSALDGEPIKQNVINQDVL